MVTLFFTFMRNKHDTMENKEEILKQLKSENPELSAEAVEKIKNEGDLTLIPPLFDLLAASSEHRTTTEIVNLLADIKDSGFVPLLMDRIKAAAQPDDKSVLLRICWESSLDFSAYAEDFINILKQDDFVAALEAATVLENMDHIEPSRKNALLARLKQIRTTDEKQFLIENILNAWN